MLLAIAAVGGAQDVHLTAAPLSSPSTRAIYSVGTPGQFASVVPGTLILSGAMPRHGKLYVADRWIVFRPEGTSDVIPVPMIITHPDGRPPVWAMRPVKRGPGGRIAFDIARWGRFETDRPSSINQFLAGRSAAEILSEQRGALVGHGTSPEDVVDAIAASGFADTLYAIAGRPRARIGLLSDAHRRAGDAALYAPTSDSIALDPFTARSVEDLRGMLAHEMGHRLQRTRPTLIDSVWSTVPVITDPEVYGFGNREEHQAEAFRFAMIFLQVTASPGRDGECDLLLLGLYESLMPGTRAVAGVLLGEPVFGKHPLRDRLAKTG